MVAEFWHGHISRSPYYAHAHTHVGLLGKCPWRCISTRHDLAWIGPVVAEFRHVDPMDKLPCRCTSTGQKETNELYLEGIGPVVTASTRLGRANEGTHGDNFLVPCFIRKQQGTIARKRGAPFLSDWLIIIQPKHYLFYWWSIHMLHYICHDYSNTHQLWHSLISQHVLFVWKQKSSTAPVRFERYKFGLHYKHYMLGAIWTNRLSNVTLWLSNLSICHTGLCTMRLGHTLLSCTR